MNYKKFGLEAIKWFVMLVLYEISNRLMSAADWLANIGGLVLLVAIAIYAVSTIKSYINFKTKEDETNS